MIETPCTMAFVCDLRDRLAWLDLGRGDGTGVGWAEVSWVGVSWVGVGWVGMSWDGVGWAGVKTADVGSLDGAGADPHWRDDRHKSGRVRGRGGHRKNLRKTLVVGRLGQGVEQANPSGGNFVKKPLREVGPLPDGKRAYVSHLSISGV